MSQLGIITVPHDLTTKGANVDAGNRLERLRLRRGECVACGTPDQPPFPPCDCTSQMFKTKRDNQRKRKALREKSAGVGPSDSTILKALKEAGIPRDVTWYIADDRATVSTGDWHEQEIYEACEKVGKKLFKNYEAPDCSEIGQPDWSTRSLHSETEPADVIHDCTVYACPVCQKERRPGCHDQAGDAAHEPKNRKAKLCVQCRPEKSASHVDTKAGSSSRDLFRHLGYSAPQNHRKSAATNIGAEDTPKEENGAADLLTALRKARRDTDNYATEKMVSSGNYKKGRINIRGVHVALENPKDSVRSGKDSNGKPWKSLMSADYGYFTNGSGTTPIAVDGDEVDAFIGPDLDSDFVVAVDQYFGGKYDETKFIICVSDQAQGEKLYLDQYQKGWKLGPVSTCTLPQLKEWLKNGEHGKPFKGQMVKSASNEFDWRWGLAGTALPAAVGSVMQPYNKHVFNPVAAAPVDMQERRLTRQLRQQALKEGFRVSGMHRPTREFSDWERRRAARPGIQSGGIMSALRGAFSKDVTAGSHYDPGVRQVYLAKGQRNPGVLAHELGHARGGKTLMRLNALGKFGAPLGLAAGMTSSDRDAAAKLTSVGSIAGAGLLASELDASRRGYQALRSLGGSRKTALKSFVGIPSYLGLASLPGLGFVAKDKLGGFDS